LTIDSLIENNFDSIKQLLEFNGFERHSNGFKIINKNGLKCVLENCQQIIQLLSNYCHNLFELYLTENSFDQNILKFVQIFAKQLQKLIIELKSHSNQENI
jgi:hypothetical protein